jgi:formate-dependent nitrite reductase membrane component NrfD
MSRMNSMPPTLPSPASGGGRTDATLPSHASGGARTGYYDLPVVKRPVWTWEIPVYFWLGGIAGGAFAAAAAADFFGTEDDRRAAARGFYAAAAAALACPPLLIADLGKPERFHHMLRIVKPLSPMNLGAWALAVFSATAVARAGAEAGHREQLPPPLAAVARLLPRRLLDLAGVAGGLVLAGYTGVLLGATNIPLWAKSRLLGGLFTASAAASGSAAATVAAMQGNVSSETLEKLATLESVATLTELGLLAAFVNQSGKTADPLTRTAASLPFWAGAIGMGAIVPLLLHRAARPRDGRVARSLRLAAALSTLAGSLALRFAVVEAGKRSAADQAASFDLSRPEIVG